MPDSGEAGAVSMETYSLSELTWQEIRARAEAGSAVVLPTGSLEQHGPHLPVKVDTTLVTAVTAEAVRRASTVVPVLLAPTVWMGLSTHHTKYFALTLSFDTYQQVLVELLESFIRTGFRRLLIVNGHGGNIDPVNMVVTKVRDRHSALVAAVSYWAAAAEAIDRIRESGPGGTGHACEFETSCMMHLEPRAVRTDRIRAEYPPEIPGWVRFDMTHGAPVKVGTRFEDITRDGVVGDPTLASADKGRRFFDAVVERLEELLRSFAAWDIDGRLKGPGARATG